MLQKTRDSLEKKIQMADLIRIPEPQLLFRYDQAIEDPRDGLTLFGPLDEGKPYGIRWGIVGTENGIRIFSDWVKRINSVIYDEEKGIARPPFYGFETIFRTPWTLKPEIQLIVDQTEIDNYVYLDDSHQRIYKTVDCFASKIISAVNEDEKRVDIWFVVIPEIIYKNCRPLSVVEQDLKVKSKGGINKQIAALLTKQYPLWEQELEDAEPYYYELNFHNQLKARLLQYRVLTQIVRETTIAPWEFPDRFDRPARGMDKLQASVAWNISTSIFYKAGGRPWKINNIRDGVCYVGMVFKQMPSGSDQKNACCAAQLFLDSGDGMVFKGNVGPWYNPSLGDYHLDKTAAKELTEFAVRTYRQVKGCEPKELFIHGKVSFNDDEWAGFNNGVDKDTNLVGVQIRESTDIKLFRDARMPILRGLGYIRPNNKSAFLWTKGYIPRLQTYPGREVPNPLYVNISKGRADILIMLSDILALTKLNYNACIYGDGLPVTLKFADAVGEILTAGPLLGEIPLPFRHYI